MIRLRIASVAVATCLAFGAAAVPAVAAPNGTGSQFQAYNFPALYNVPVTGKSQTGNQQFSGTYGIQRVVAHNGRPYAVGTLKGTFAGHRFTRYGVMTPISVNQDPSAAASRAGHAAAQNSCQVLNLVIGPIHLNLLGLVLDVGGNGGTGPITVNLTANPSQGPLGSLLCGISNALNTNGLLGQIQSDLSNLTSLLNSLIGAASGL